MILKSPGGNFGNKEAIYDNKADRTITLSDILL